MGKDVPLCQHIPAEVLNCTLGVRNGIHLEKSRQEDTEECVMAVPPLQGQGACLSYHLNSFTFTSCAGRKTKYTYVVMYEIVDGEERPHGLAKIDLTASSPAAAATISFGRGRSGGEAVFIPSSTNPAELKGAHFVKRLLTCLTVQHGLTTSRPCLYFTHGHPAKKIARPEPHGNYQAASARISLAASLR